MASTYSSFLQSPSTSHLASDASIHYITTTTSISEPTAILKHLHAQQKLVVVKEQKVLSATEGPSSLCLETDTTLLFNNGGGAYLPAMDENLLDEKLVTLPLLHIVNFDADQRIKQIRLYWDSGTLLKQVQAIGRTGRNWPLREGKAQIDLITKSLKSGGVDPDIKGSSGSAPSNRSSEVVSSGHQKRTSVSATRDPHASLALFKARDPNEDVSRSYEGPKFAPRESAKPAPRNYGELFAASGEEEADAGPTAAGAQARSSSPHKQDGTILKAGAGKHHTNNRLFDEKEETDTLRSPERRKKTYDQKYDHFAFGDGEDAPQDARPTSGNSKHQPTFSFEDFATPPKHQAKFRRDDERHWGSEEAPPSPPKRPIVHAPRPDADTHFKLADESSPAPVPPQQKSLQRQKGMNIYHDPLAGGRGDESSDEEFQHHRPATASSSTTSNNARRGADFASTYSMTDSGGSPATQTQNNLENVRPQGVGAKRSDMEPHWEFGTPKVEKKIYKTAGDGMGSRATKDGRRAWGIGDESDPEVDAAVRPSARRRN